MTTREKRIQISPTPDLAAALRDLAKLTGKPQSRVLVELLDEVVPTLQVMAQALRVAKQAPREAEALMAGLATRSIHHLTQEQINFSEALKAKPGRKKGPPRVRTP